MQVIPIVWPILVSAFLAGVLLAWVLFVVLPRMRRADRWRGSRIPLRGVPAEPHPSGTRVVDADQHVPRQSL